MSTAVSEAKTRAAKPWDKLRRARSQPTSPKSPVDDGPFHVLVDGKHNELNIVLPTVQTTARVSNLSRTEPNTPAARTVPEETPTSPSPLKEKALAPSKVYARSKSDSSAAAEKSLSATQTAKPKDSEKPKTSPERMKPAETNEDRAAETSTTKESSEDFTWLLTRQLEVEMSLRGKPPASQSDVEKTRKLFHDFTVFFETLKQSSAKLSMEASKSVKNYSPPKGGVKERTGFLVPPDNINSHLACEPSHLFQELLHRVAGFGINSGQSIDEQTGQKNVPMHQAKVLYRKEVFENDVLTKCDEVLGEDTVRELTEMVKQMRLILKVKIEDANDVRMAEEAVAGAHLFFEKLKVHSIANGKEDFEILKKLREA